MNKIVDILVAQWEWDISVMSDPWMYWCLMIPIFFFICFLVVKWAIITVPVWLPVAIVVSVFRKDNEIIPDSSKDNP